MIVLIGERSAITAVCERLGEHLWEPVGYRTRCLVCGAVQADVDAFYTYDLYLRGLVEDGGGDR